MSDAAEHLARFTAHYNRFSNVADDQLRVKLAERFASNLGLSFLIGDTRSSVAPYPFFHEDYADIQPLPKVKR